MSILLLGLYEELGTATIARLVEEGDEVRVLENDPGSADAYRSLGAHIATGSPSDGDLIERAAQNVRTIVVGPATEEYLEDVIAAVLEGGARANPKMRVVVCAPELPHDALEALRDGPLDFIALITGKPRRFFSAAVPEADVARAIDAADDLSGEPRGELDLTNDLAWGELRLEPPAD